MQSTFSAEHLAELLDVSLGAISCVKLLPNATAQVGSIGTAPLPQPQVPPPPPPEEVENNETNATNRSVEIDNVTDPLPPPGLQYTIPARFGAVEGGWLLEAGPLDRLLGGRRYRVCTDLDGSGNSKLRVGDTGLTVYASPITSVTPRSIVKGSDEMLVLACGRDTV